MNILKLFIIVSLVTLISSCTKEKLGSNINVIPETYQHALSVQHDMLVFDTERSFDTAIEKVNKMGDAERKSWEKELGYKSFDSSISEMNKEQNAHEEKFAHLSKEELYRRVENGEIEEYSPLMKEYMDKGIIEINIDENNVNSIDINYPMYSSLVNIDGFVAVGNEILQYTRYKFKLIKSLDFNKLEQLMTIKGNVDDENFFVTSINGREKVTVGKIFEYTAESYTNNRERVVATETYQYYDRKHDGRNFEANYTMRIKNQKKKYKWFRWRWFEEESRTWMWGDFDFKTKENGTYNVNLSYPDVKIRTKTVTMIKREFSRYDYNSYHGGPEILRSTWNIVRWGGAHGLGVRLIDHVRYERF